MGYANADVAHEFAHKTGKKQKGSNMFYEVHAKEFWTIYSFGHHFAMTTLLPERIAGPFVALVTSKDWPGTYTNRHKAHVGNATSHYEKIYVPRLTDKYYNRWSGEFASIKNAKSYLQEDLRKIEEELEDLAEKHVRARKYSYDDQIWDGIINTRKFVNLFHAKPLLTGKLRKVIYENMNRFQALEVYIGKENQERIRERQLATQRRERKRREEKIQKFHNGEIDSVFGADHTYLRTEAKGIRTSKGILITNFRAAKELWKIIQYVKKQAIEMSYPVDRAGSVIHLAGYQIQKIFSNGNVRAGCHLIPYSESERIAKELGWI